MTEIDTSTEAVGRLWAFAPDIFDGMSVWQDQPSPAGDTVEYVRADIYVALAAERDALKAQLDYQTERLRVALEDSDADALVAAAYEAAFEALRARDAYIAPDQAEAYDRGWSRAIRTSAEHIRALTPDDARAALGRMLAEAVAKERERCAKLAETYCKAYATDTYDKAKQAERLQNAARCYAAGDIAAERDALKEREQAIVAAAYEEAAATLALPEDAAPPQDAVDQILDWQRRTDAKTIRALTPADARAALDRMLAEAEARGVEKAREKIADALDAKASDYEAVLKLVPQDEHAVRSATAQTAEDLRLQAAAIREGETP